MAKGPQRAAKGRKGPQRAAKGRKAHQHAAKRPNRRERAAKGRKGPQRAAKGHKGPQRAAKGHKGPQRAAKGRKGPQRAAKGRKWPQRAPRVTRGCAVIAYKCYYCSFLRISTKTQKNVMFYKTIFWPNVGSTFFCENDLHPVHFFLKIFFVHAHWARFGPTPFCV